MENGIGGAADEAAIEVVAAAGCKSYESGAAFLGRIHDLSGRIADGDDGLDFYSFVLQPLCRTRDEEVSLVYRGRGTGGVRVRLSSVGIRQRRNRVADGDRSLECFREALDDGQYVSRVIGAVYRDENPVKLGDGRLNG